jgi:N6-adenosine-specific RNA methylase IME4
MAAKRNAARRIGLARKRSRKKSEGVPASKSLGRQTVRNGDRERRVTASRASAPSDPSRPRKPRSLNDVINHGRTPAIPRAADWRPGARPSGELTLKLSQIKIGERHRKDFGDVAALARDINERGLLQPVVIDHKNRLIAGERRMRAWQLSLFRDEPSPVRVVPLQNIIAGEYAENDPTLRKAFTPSEAVAIKQAIEAELKPGAIVRKAHGKAAAAVPAGRAGDRAAAFTGKSRRTIEKAEAIVAAAAAAPERFGKLQADMDKSGRVDGPFKRLVAMKAADAIRKAPPPVPGADEPYIAGSIDVPWSAEPDSDNPSRLDRGYYPYPTMTPAQAAAYLKEHLAPRLARRATVAIWITNFHLINGHHLPILEALELKGSTMLTWVKDGIGQGQVARGSTEHVIIATRGRPVIETFPRTDFRGAVDRKAHSRKPQSFYELFERHVPAPRYFSLFETVARGPKWDVHGDKAPASSSVSTQTNDASAIPAPAKPARKRDRSQKKAEVPAPAPVDPRQVGLEELIARREAAA